MSKQKTPIYKEDVLAIIGRVLAESGNVISSCTASHIEKMVKAMPAAEGVADVVHCEKCAFGDKTETFETYRHCQIDRKMHPATHHCGYGRYPNQTVLIADELEARREHANA